jgi:type IV pilus assembly protein PilE
MNRTRRAGRSASRPRGFTLIELMIAVAIVGILVGIALPTYRAYIVRGKLVAGTSALASLRTSMEQYYLDNRTYLDASTNIKSPCSFATAGSNVADTFTLSCTGLTAATYKLVATGAGPTLGAVYTVDQRGLQTTEGLPSVLGDLPASHKCWIMRRGDAC